LCFKEKGHKNLWKWESMINTPIAILKKQTSNKFYKAHMILVSALTFFSLQTALADNQLLSISPGPFLCPQPEDSCLGDKRTNITRELRYL
jgi:hypothetical protein